MNKAHFALILLALSVFPQARAQDARIRAIGPFVDNEVLGVGHIDLTKVDVEKLIGELIADKERAEELAQTVSPWLSALRKAGARDIYTLAVLPDLLSPTMAPFPAVVPLEPGADERAIGELLCGRGSVKGPLSWPTCASVHGAVFAGSHEALDRVRQLNSMDRPEFSAALAAVGGSAAEFVLIPSSDTRRVVEELLPNLPAELGGGPITDVTKGMVWTAVGLKVAEQPGFTFVLEARDGQAAHALNQLGKKALTYLCESTRVARYVPNLAGLTESLKVEVNQERLTITSDARGAASLAVAILRPLRENSMRTQCKNNMKYIGLAMHNYHSTHHTFPTAFTVDKAGKPLLSWRVLILPYIEQEALYKEFHLDEPWDSPHNKTLIDRMPPTYRCPSARVRHAHRGMTSYLAPRGPSTIFPGAEGVKIQKITDGTSNTIFAVDAGDERAVPWTKPDDWDVEPMLDTKGIFGHHPEGTYFLFADGSVHFLKETINLEVLRKLITCAGGEVVGSDEY